MFGGYVLLAVMVLGYDLLCRRRPVPVQAVHVCSAECCQHDEDVDLGDPTTKYIVMMHLPDTASHYVCYTDTLDDAEDLIEELDDQVEDLLTELEAWDVRQPKPELEEDRADWLYRRNMFVASLNIHPALQMLIPDMEPEFEIVDVQRVE